MATIEFMGKGGMILNKAGGRGGGGREGGENGFLSRGV